MLRSEPSIIESGVLTTEPRLLVNEYKTDQHLNKLYNVHIINIKPAELCHKEIDGLGKLQV
jgi:hypothetical protein